MSFFTWLRRLAASPETPVRAPDDLRRHDRRTGPAAHASPPGEGQGPDEIRGGIRLDREDAAEIPLALGNLFRAQGDIDRAVRVREAALAVVSAPDFKARVLFELGRDYRKAGLLDRALNAYREARRLGFPPGLLGADLTQLHADSGDFQAAAEESARLGNRAAQAYYLVCQARESAATGNDAEAARLLRHALGIHAGSPEARLALAVISLLGGDANRTVEELRAGLCQSPPSGRLILLEGFHSFIRGASAPDINPGVLHETLDRADAVLAENDADLTTCYYAGLFAQADGKDARAEQWFTKALVLDPDFWAARLAILALAAARESLPPLLAAQIAFFTEQGARSKRFLCPPCGMRRDTIFSQCPRCLAWHSAAFRQRLT